MSRVWAVASALIVVMSGCGQRPIESMRTTGDFRFDRGDYPEAAAEYARITERAPGDWRAQYRLGMCLLKMDRPDEARLALEIALDQKPREARIADELAEAMYQQGDEAQLFVFLRERAESRQTVEAYLRLARYASAAGDPDYAQLGYETAIALAGGRAVQPYLEAADFARRVGDLDQAMALLRRAYAIDPRDPRITDQLRNLGEIPGPTLGAPPQR